MIESNPRIHQGGCLCGAILYQAQGQPLVIAHCHCKDCQRESGAGHSTGAMFSADGFRLTWRVAEFKRKSENGNEVTRVFCPTCGSPILGRNSGAEGYVTLTLGTLDHSDEFEPQVVVFARNRKAWDVMDESLPSYEAQPNWTPGDGV